MGVLAIMRGFPGSGKSFRAEQLRDENPGSVIFSTDEFFMKSGQYEFKVSQLGQAHHWNQLRFQKAVENSHPFIIIDNTNVRKDEIYNYSDYALGQDYEVRIVEPNSSWWIEHRHMLFDKRAYKKELKSFAELLANKNSHGVPFWIIDRSIRRWQECSANDLLDHFTSCTS